MEFTNLWPAIVPNAWMFPRPRRQFSSHCNNTIAMGPPRSRIRYNQSKDIGEMDGPNGHSLFEGYGLLGRTFAVNMIRLQPLRAA
jgi:hypothetical protein